MGGGGESRSSGGVETVVALVEKEETVVALEEEECDWRIIPSCIIPQLSLFIQLDKQIIPSSLFIATIIHHRAGRPKKSHPPQANTLFLTSTGPQTSRVGVGVGG